MVVGSDSDVEGVDADVVGSSAAVVDKGSIAENVTGIVEVSRKEVVDTDGKVGIDVGSVSEEGSEMDSEVVFEFEDVSIYNPSGILLMPMEKKGKKEKRRKRGRDLEQSSARQHFSNNQITAR